ncbi:MAG: T9SS type A sorting domain-containing protein [Bacteroidales bacterium]|nr:T9SS type A sorting domain-containing protein [Bacteroidales bacterium]
MKRIFTLVVAVLCCAVVFAQANYSQHLMRNANRSMVSKKIEKPNKTREGEIWACTFEEETPLYTTGQVTASNANWELQELSESDGGTYYLALNYLPEDIYSETPNHWMMIDADGHATQTTPGNGYDFDSYMTISGIDLTDAENPQLGFYEYRRLTNMPTDMEATVVEVSTNGGASWTKHVVGCEAYSEHTYAYRRVPIFEAAGHDNVAIRFHANRRLSVLQATFGATVTYADAPFIVVWQVDDLVIEEAQAFDLLITDVRMNEGRCDYYSNTSLSSYDPARYQLNPMYGMTPRSEWESPYKWASFNVAVENRGSENVVPIVHVAVTAPDNHEVWSIDFEGEEIGAFGRDTLDIMEDLGNNQIDKVFAFSEDEMQNIQIGEYTVTYTVSTEAGDDPTPQNNVASHHFYITEKAYCPATPNITTTSGPTVWGSFVDGDEILVDFEYYSLPDDEIPLYLYIDSTSTPGTAIAANIYEINEGGTAFELTNTSGTYTIQEADLGQWIHITFDTPIEYDEFDPESESKYIRVGVAFTLNGENNDLYLGASRDMPSKGWICSYIMGGGQASSINVSDDTNAPAICLGNPNDENLTTIATSEANEITMFPNPSNGIVNFTNVENATIEVYNMMGQVVASESNANANASIDLSGVANGNYIVRIVKDGEIATSKLNIVK